jgi:hypothetical protein
LLLGLGLCGSAPALHAQTGLSFWIGGTGTALRTRTAIGGAVTGLRGQLFGGEGSLLTGRLALRVSYVEGSASSGGLHRDQVEGLVLVGAQPVRGLTLTAGPHVMAFTDSTTQRWVEWQVRGRYEGPLVERFVRGYLEGWAAVAGSAHAVGDFGGARGGGAGLLVRLGDTPIVARLGYAIAESRLKAGVRRETVEGLSIGLGYSR